jgi:hypothetical protein
MAVSSTLDLATIIPNELSETRDSCGENDHRKPWWRTYFSKWSGQHKDASHQITWLDCTITFVGTCLAVGILGVVHFRLFTRQVQRVKTCVGIQHNSTDNFFLDMIWNSSLLPLALQQCFSMVHRPVHSPNLGIS